MTEFHDGPGNVIQESLEFLSKMDKVVTGKLVVGGSPFDDESDDELPEEVRSRTSSTGSGCGETIYHGNAVQELREFFSKLDRVVNGKLIAGDSINDDSDDDDDVVVAPPPAKRRC